MNLALLPINEAFDPSRLQREASDPRRSVWVNASAGSGKTTVLTKRVIRLLLDGVRPERLLCLTFTRAAAAEMSIRVAGKLSTWATCSDNELRDSLSDLQGYPPSKPQKIQARRLFAQTLACPGGMRIRTIHAFCQEILRRFPIEAGLPPHFAVIEEADAKALQEEVLRTLLHDFAAVDTEASRALRLLIAELGESGFRKAMQQVLHDRSRIEKAIASAGGLPQLRVLVRNTLGLNAEDTEESILARAVDFSVLPFEAIHQAARWQCEGSDTNIKLGEKILKWLYLPVSERIAQFDAYAHFFLTQKNELLVRYSIKAVLLDHPELDSICRNEARRLLAVLEKQEAAQIADITNAVITVGSELAGRYQSRKLLQAALDYDDLIIRASELLNRSGIAQWVLYKLDGGLDHILVDEAQDTSRAQWNIIAALTEEFFAGKGAKDNVNRSLFVVGDEKQSIFSFQNADPEAFADMRRFFAQRIRQADKAYDEIPMNVSFRSADAILQAVDCVFAENRARAGVAPCPITHQPNNKHKCGRVEVWPLLVVPEKKTAEGVWPLPINYESERDPQAELAAEIADKIAGWLKTKEILSGSDSPISAGDIMILLRRRGRFADLMVRALKAREVPVTGIDRMRLIEQIAVMDLLALLHFTLLPDDDLNLATVLRGPLLGLSEDDLMRLAIGRTGTLWQSLQNSTHAQASEYLSRWSNRADFMTPYALLAQILTEPCPANSSSGRRAIWSRLGHDALDPIEELLNAAQNYSRNHAPSLQAFLHWLSLSDDEIKRELDRGSGEVRIMTVHASKGLEAPIVFLPDTAAIPRSGEVPQLQWMDDALPFYLPRKPTSGAAQNIWEAAREKQLGEYRRLMYVALTRSASQLYIAGWHPPRTFEYEGSWYDLAATSLKAKHEPAKMENCVPEPITVFGDNESRSLPSLTPTVEQPVAEVVLPDWILRSVPTERRESKIVAPSQMVDSPAATTPNEVFARGLIIHRLLESLPDMDDAERDRAAARFLAHPQHALNAELQAEIAAEVLGLLRHPECAVLFGTNSRSEVPLAGIINGKRISGQIDRLSITDDAVWIIDYKTNRKPPQSTDDVPAAYRAQMKAYRDLLQAIYPNKATRCFLLWTVGARLMEITATL